MKDKPSDFLEEIIRLVNELPSDPSAYAELPSKVRTELREELEAAIVRLSEVSQVLDVIRQPQLIFDPTAPKVIGKLVADTLLLQDRIKLDNAVKQPFYGAGVYAIYYRGGFDCYSLFSKKEHPIYVGKADPKELHAATPVEQGPKLFGRLKDHHRSLSKTVNLDVGDFDCRHLVVRSAWVETAEDHLIDVFKPVWNREVKVCYGFGKHGDSPETRSNQRSPWDTLHAGRGWATSAKNTPNDKTISEIKAAIIEHLEKYPGEK